MTSPDQIPDQCPKCGGDVGLRPQIEKTLGSRGMAVRPGLHELGNRTVGGVRAVGRGL